MGGWIDMCFLYCSCAELRSLTKDRGDGSGRRLNGIHFPWMFVFAYPIREYTCFTMWSSIRNHVV